MGTTYTYLEKRRDGKLQFLRRNANGNIYIRFRLPKVKNYIYKSTHTKDLQNGYRIGLDIYDEMKWKNKNNISVFDHDFKHIWSEWFDYRVNHSGHTPRIKVIESTGRLYFLPYFGNCKSNEINDSFIEKYWDWRKRYWVDGYGAKERENAKKSRSRRTTKDPTKKYRNLKGNVAEKGQIKIAKSVDRKIDLLADQNFNLSLLTFAMTQFRAGKM